MVAGRIRVEADAVAPQLECQVLVRPTVARRNAVGEDQIRQGLLHCEDVMVRTLAALDRRRWGRAARMNRTWEREGEIDGLLPGRLIEDSKAPAGGPPAFVTSRSSPPRACTASSTSLVGTAEIAHVAGEADHLDAGLAGPTCLQRL